MVWDNCVWYTAMVYIVWYTILWAVSMAWYGMGFNSGVVLFMCCIVTKFRALRQGRVWPGTQIGASFFFRGHTTWYRVNLHPQKIRSNSCLIFAQKDGFMFDGARLAEGAAYLARLRDDRALCRRMGEEGRIKVILRLIFWIKIISNVICFG